MRPLAFLRKDDFFKSTFWLGRFGHIITNEYILSSRIQPVDIFPSSTECPKDAHSCCQSPMRLQDVRNLGSSPGSPSGILILGGILQLAPAHTLRHPCSFQHFL